MIQLMLAEKAREPFDSSNHLFEGKDDGARWGAHGREGGGQAEGLAGARWEMGAASAFEEIEGCYIRPRCGRYGAALEVREVLDGE